MLFLLNEFIQIIIGNYCCSIIILFCCSFYLYLVLNLNCILNDQIPSLFLSLYEPSTLSSFNLYLKIYLWYQQLTSKDIQIKYLQINQISFSHPLFLSVFILCSFNIRFNEMRILSVWDHQPIIKTLLSICSMIYPKKCKKYLNLDILKLTKYLTIQKTKK